jgi:hypothetical protein
MILVVCDEALDRVYAVSTREAMNVDRSSKLV